LIKIAVLVSGGGTNLQALIDAWKENRFKNETNSKTSPAQISLVVSSIAGAFAVERAKKAGIKTIVIERKNYAHACDFDVSLVSVLKDHDINLIVLAGFLCILGEQVLTLFENRIINVHPSLIPSFCGKGFYGLNVHKAVLEKGVKVTGATVHLVNSEIDGGKILLQKAIDVLPGDTPESLQQRVMRECEWVLLPKAVSMLCNEQNKKGD